MRGTAASRLASGSTMVPELFPSSSVTRLSPAFCRMCAPTGGLPVKETFAGTGCLTSASPVTGPSPWTSSSTPSGRPGLAQAVGHQHAR